MIYDIGCTIAYDYDRPAVVPACASRLFFAVPARPRRCSNASLEKALFPAPVAPSAAPRASSSSGVLRRRGRPGRLPREEARPGCPRQSASRRGGAPAPGRRASASRPASGASWEVAGSARPSVDARAAAAQARTGPAAGDDHLLAGGWRPGAEQLERRCRRQPRGSHLTVSLVTAMARRLHVRSSPSRRLQDNE